MAKDNKNQMMDNLINDDNAVSASSFKDFNEYTDTNESNKNQGKLIKSDKNNKLKVNISKIKKKRKASELKSKISRDEKQFFEQATSALVKLKADIDSLKSDINKSNNTTPVVLDGVAVKSMLNKVNSDTTNNLVSQNINVTNVVETMETDTSVDNTDISVINVGSNESGPSGINPNPWETIPINKSKRLRKVKVNKDDANDNRYALLLIDDDDDKQYSDEEVSIPMLKREKKIHVSTISTNSGSVNKRNDVNIRTKSVRFESGIGANVTATSNINAGASTSRAKHTVQNSGYVNPGVEVSDNKSKKVRTPPIICYDLKQKELRDSLIGYKTTKYKISTNANSSRCVINAEDEPTHKNILMLLRASNVNFYTFTPKSEQGTKLILKNIPRDYNVNDITVELNSLKLLDDIERLIPLDRGSCVRFNYFLIKLKPGVKIAPYINLKLLCNSKICIEKFNQTDVVQCFKCQRPGHVSANCHMDARCVKCGLTHGKDDCKINKESPRALLKCVLCKNTGHTSNYRGCEYLKKIIEEKIKKKNVIRKERSNFVQNSINNLVNPRVSYSGAIRNNVSFIPDNNFSSFPPLNKSSASNNNANQPPQTDSIFNMQNILNDAAQEMFGCNFATLKSSFDKFMYNFNVTEDPETKRNALFDFMLATNY